MDLGLTGRVALVAAASGGLGLAVARALVAEGAKVAITSRSAERIEAAAESIGARGYVHETAAVEAVPELVGRVRAELGGPVEILVTNTGGPPADPDALAFTTEQWQAAYRDLVLAPMALVREVLPGMRERRWGRVINISSIHGLIASPYKSAYISAKHGLEGLSKVVALEGGPRGVTSNCICPAYVRTPLVESQIADQARTHGISEDEVVEKIMLTEPAIKRLIEPEEVAEVAAFLCAPEASFINGASLTMDGGATAH